MQRRRVLLVVGLGCLAVLSALLAFAIYEISAAHGHGLAYPDRRAIRVLVLVASAAALGSLWVAVGRR